MRGILMIEALYNQTIADTKEGEFVESELVWQTFTCKVGGSGPFWLDIDKNDYRLYKSFEDFQRFYANPPLGWGEGIKTRQVYRLAPQQPKEQEKEKTAEEILSEWAEWADNFRGNKAVISFDKAVECAKSYATQQNAIKDTRIENMIEVFKWLLGYYDFPEYPKNNHPRYYWRTHLRRKLKEISIEVDNPSDEEPPAEIDVDKMINAYIARITELQNTLNDQCAAYDKLVEDLDNRVVAKDTRISELEARVKELTDEYQKAVKLLRQNNINY